MMDKIILGLLLIFGLGSCSIQQDAATEKVKVEKTREAATKVNSTTERGAYSK